MFPHEYKWLSPEIVARRLDLSVETVYRMIKKGDLTCYKFSGSLKVLEADFFAYLKSCKQNIN